MDAEALGCAVPLHVPRMTPALCPFLYPNVRYFSAQYNIMPSIGQSIREEIQLQRIQTRVSPRHLVLAASLPVHDGNGGLDHIAGPLIVLPRLQTITSPRLHVDVRLVDLSLMCCDCAAKLLPSVSDQVCLYAISVQEHPKYEGSLFRLDSHLQSIIYMTVQPEYERALNQAPVLCREKWQHQLWKPHFHSATTASIKVGRAWS